MKELTQALDRGRFGLRRIRSRLPMISRGVVPIRVVCHLGTTAEISAENEAEPLSQIEWKSALVDLVAWLGPVRVCVDCRTDGQIPLAMDLIRLAHRLECATHLVCMGPVSSDQALELIDRGLGAVTLRVGGLDERTQQLVLNGKLEAVSATMSAFSEARALRERDLFLQVNIAAHDENVESIGSIAGWAYQAGADAVSLGLLLGAPVPRGILDVMERLPDVETPSALVRFLNRDASEIAGARLSLSASGGLSASLTQSPFGNVRDESPQSLWAKNKKAVQEALHHERPFDEVELLPLNLRCRR